MATLFANGSTRRPLRHRLLDKSPKSSRHYEGDKVTRSYPNEGDSYHRDRCRLSTGHMMFRLVSKRTYQEESCQGNCREGPNDTGPVRVNVDPRPK